MNWPKIAKQLLNCVGLGVGMAGVSLILITLSNRHLQSLHPPVAAAVGELNALNGCESWVAQDYLESRPSAVLSRADIERFRVRCREVPGSLSSFGVTPLEDVSMHKAQLAVLTARGADKTSQRPATP